jgi:hypothetical protein
VTGVEVEFWQVMVTVPPALIDNVELAALTKLAPPITNSATETTNHVRCFIHPSLSHAHGLPKLSYPQHETENICNPAERE